MPTQSNTPTNQQNQQQNQPDGDSVVTLDNFLQQPDEPAGDDAQQQDQNDQQTPDPKVNPEDQQAGDEPQDEPKEDAAPADDANKDKNKGTRDYNKFDESDRPFLKQMSKAAFEHFEKRLSSFKGEIAQKDEVIQSQQKQLEGKELPERWYEDPEAFKAAPEYKEAEGAFHEAQKATTFWTQQLDRFENGQDYYLPDPATGKLRAVTAAEGKKSDQRVLSDLRMQTFEEQKTFAAKANGIAKSFAETYKSAESHVQSSTEKLFPWTKDEKSEKQKFIKDFEKQWPKAFQKSPVTKFTNALAVEFIDLKQKYNTLLKQIETGKSVKNDQRRAGPNPGRNGKASAPSVNEDQKLTLDDFKEC